MVFGGKNKQEKASTQHNEHSEHEAVLTGVVALASLFSNCVEAFGLIHASHKWEKEEQLLLCRLGIQQARLLIWGHVTGVSSPPSSVTNQAVPKHPSAAYPDLKEPTFFGPRDERLDETENRKAIETALSAIVDRSAGLSREEMMEKYGLKTPKRLVSEFQPAWDTNRIEAFREQYELLREVAETYAQINTRRASSITHTSWVVADNAKFGNFVKLTQEKVDFLIGMMEVKARVDQGMRMDIKGLGWHLSDDRQRVALDVSKLKLISEACKGEYPEYLPAAEQALQNIDRERRENMPTNPYTSGLASSESGQEPSATTRRGSTPIARPEHVYANANTNGDKPKRPGLFGGIFKSFGGKRSSKYDVNAGRSKSVSAASGETSYDDPPRSMSDSGPVRQSGSTDSMGELEPTRSKSVGAMPDMPPTTYVRSKSVGDILETQPETDEEAHHLANRLEKLDTNATAKDEPLEHSVTMDMDFAVSRHDQFHGLGRQGTKTQS